MKLTAGAKLFIVVSMLVPVLLIVLLVVDFDIPNNAPVVKRKTGQVKFNDLYKFVKKNKKWYPFTYGLLEFYK